jgi:hypothetical protein
MSVSSSSRRSAEREIGLMKIVFMSLALLVSLVGALYCFFGILMAGSLGATPNYPRTRLEYNVSFWSSGTLLFLAIAFLFGFLLIRNYTRGR